MERGDVFLARGHVCSRGRAPCAGVGAIYPRVSRRRIRCVSRATLSGAAENFRRLRDHGKSPLSGDLGGQVRLGRRGTVDGLAQTFGDGCRGEFLARRGGRRGGEQQYCHQQWSDHV